MSQVKTGTTEPIYKDVGTGISVIRHATKDIALIKIERNKQFTANVPCLDGALGPDEIVEFVGYGTTFGRYTSEQVSSLGLKQSVLLNQVLR